jgi:hypothetical protein
MQNRRFAFYVPIAIIAAVGMALIGFFWLGDTAPVVPVAPTPEVKIVPKVTSGPAGRSNVPGPTNVRTAGVDATPPQAPMSAADRAQEAAEQRIGDILAQNATVEQARTKLLMLFPTFNPSEKIASAPHIVNLVEDAQLPTMIGFLKNPTTPPEAQEAFFNDMLNRQPEVGWPVLVEVIATPKHRLADQAKELLTTIVGADHGNDVFAWQRALREQLIQQGAIPEDPAAAGQVPAATNQ